MFWILAPYKENLTLWPLPCRSTYDVVVCHSVLQHGGFGVHKWLFTWCILRSIIQTKPVPLIRRVLEWNRGHWYTRDVRQSNIVTLYIVGERKSIAPLLSRHTHDAHTLWLATWHTVQSFRDIVKCWVGSSYFFLSRLAPYIFFNR